MKTEEMKIADLIPYERNAKMHDERQIQNVMESIKQFGFAQPLVVDKNNVLIIGHCRLIAAKRLHKKTVPVVRMDELTPSSADLPPRRREEAPGGRKERRRGWIREASASATRRSRRS